MLRLWIDRGAWQKNRASKRYYRSGLYLYILELEDSPAEGEHRPDTAVALEPTKQSRTSPEC